MRRASRDETGAPALRGAVDADARALRQLTLLVLAGLVCTVSIIAFLIFGAIQAVNVIDTAAIAHEQLQVTRAVAAAPGGMNEITLSAMAETLDLDRARLTTVASVVPGEATVPIGGDRVVAWTPHRFGTRTFGILAPLRILAGLVFGLMVAAIGWRVHAVGRRLDRRRAIAARLAMTDALTGLDNRLAFDAALAARCAAAETGGAGFVLVSIDLDGFKAINDALGHAAGDEALQAVAAQLREVAAPDDLVARIGGDEFAVIRSGSGLDAYVADMLRRIATATPPGISGLRLAASFGIARSEDFPGPLKLSRAADAALYRAKRNGRGNAELAVPPPVVRRRAA